MGTELQTKRVHPFGALFSAQAHSPFFLFFLASSSNPLLPFPGGPTWVRTRDLPVMSRWLFQLSYGPTLIICHPPGVSTPCTTSGAWLCPERQSISGRNPEPDMVQGYVSRKLLNFL